MKKNEKFLNKPIIVYINFSDIIVQGIVIFRAAGSP